MRAPLQDGLKKRFNFVCVRESLVCVCVFSGVGSPVTLRVSVRRLVWRRPRVHQKMRAGPQATNPTRAAATTIAAVCRGMCQPMMAGTPILRRMHQGHQLPLWVAGTLPSMTGTPNHLNLWHRFPQQRHQAIGTHRSLGGVPRRRAVPFRMRGTAGDKIQPPVTRRRANQGNQNRLIRRDGTQPTQTLGEAHREGPLQPRGAWL